MLDPRHWDFWVLIGFAGQFLFGARFIVQWISSERVKRSHIPVQFWYLSLIGGSITTAYAIHRRDPVFIVGQASGLIVYVRNLMLIHRHADRQSTPDAPPHRS
jgi:lipid-A-disaccharide synthase-like uncharacterized protein